jgi:quercetin dioxygenase-like cupin family protein
MNITKVILIIIILSGSSLVLADDVIRKFISEDELTHIPGQKVTSVTVELAPGVSVPAHRHEAFVYVYVLEGTVRSQLDEGELIEYKTGDSWVEAPNVLHSLTQNASDQEIAKILAVFIAKTGAKLTTSGEISH